jgi:hypothetical protein
MAKERKEPVKCDLGHAGVYYFEILERLEKKGDRGMYATYLANDIVDKDVVSFNHTARLGPKLEVGKVYLIVSKGVKQIGSFETPDVRSWELEPNDFKLLDEHGPEKAALLIQNGDGANVPS